MVQFILIDTDILIDAGRKVENAVARLDIAEKEAVLGISVITQMELIVGCRNKTELRILERFLKRFDVFSLNETISGIGLDLLLRYRLSHDLLIADALIAATAITSKVPLLTKNQKDYRFIEELELLPYP